jgi:hypothetical protein
VNGPSFLTVAPAQWTVKLVVDAAHWISDQVKRVETALRMNNGLVMQINQRVSAIPDQETRDKARAAIQIWVARQAELVSSYRDFTRKWTDALNKARAFLSGMGLAPGTLGQLQVIPIAIIAGILITVGGYIVSLQIRSANQRKALDMISEVTDKWGQGKLNEVQARSILASIDASQKAAEPSDPFGLSKMLEKAAPIAMILGAVLLLPPLLEAFGAVRRRRIAA